MKNFISHTIDKCISAWEYFYQGVWESRAHNWRVATIKTLSLSVRAFMNSQLWVRAAALTYNTVLAIVPALALVFAICRGFGFQNLLEDSMRRYFPAQSDFLTEGLKYADSYLNSYSEGLFVGAGILFLLWSLFSLMSNVEDAFNEAWSVKVGRSFFRKVTDYLSIFFILPILMICSSGINIVMSTTLHTFLPWDFLQSAISWVLDLLSLALIWLFFTGTFLLVPNTKVKFVNALIAGVFTGTAYMILQWLFVTGQVYVSRYNAIYGSFAFIPLLLIWLQLVWLITLSGAVVCYALQNIYNISYIDKVSNISPDYDEKVTIAVMTIVVNEFKKGTTPPNVSTIAHDYLLPANLVSRAVARLETAGMIRKVIAAQHSADPGFVPAYPIDTITVGKVLTAIRGQGESDFIPEFNKEFAGVIKAVDRLEDDAHSTPGAGLLKNIQIKKNNKNEKTD